MCFSVRPRSQIFVNGYVLLTFVKNKGENICKNISKKWEIEW